MVIGIGDIVRSASGGLGPVLEMTVIDGVTLYWIDFTYGYLMERRSPNHKMWAGDVTLIQPGTPENDYAKSVTSSRTIASAESVTSSRTIASAESVTSFTSLSVCMNCGETIKSKRSHKKTCSSSCRKALSRKLAKED